MTGAVWARSRPYAAALCAQGASSLTSLALTVGVARAAGLAGLGVFALGYFGLLASLTVIRAAVIQPFVIESSRLEDVASHTAMRAALTTAVSAGAALATLLLAVSHATSGDLASGLRKTWWILPGYAVYDCLRSARFRHRQYRFAVYVDCLILVVIVGLALPSVKLHASGVLIVGWGVAVALGGIAHAIVARVAPIAPTVATRRWLKESAPVAWWLAGEAILGNLTSLTGAIVVSSSLSASALGGLRAVQSLLTPISLLGPAATLVGLPRLSRAARVDRLAAGRLSLAIGAVGATIAGLYVVGVFSVPAASTAVMGVAFRGYQHLGLPVGLGQVAEAAVMGASLLFQVSGRAAAWFLIRAVAAILTLAGVTVSAMSGSLDGVAWSIAGGSLVMAGGMALGAWRRPLRTAEVAAGRDASTENLVG